MNKIRTAEELYDLLSKDLVWRKRELSQMKSLITGHYPTVERHRCLIRAGMTLLYAHWEGFVKESSTAYLRFVASQRLLYKDIAPNILAIAMKRRLDEAKTANRTRIYIEISDFFLNKMTDRCVIPWDSTIDTRSNLSSAILQDIMIAIGLDYTVFATRSALIDEKLLKHRNVIAHGEYLLIDKEDYIYLHDEIVAMLVQYSDMVTNAAVTESFRTRPISI